jgi:hypothetical protein
MNHSGDAAEQIVHISLEGVDYALRIAGAGAKNIAAFLLAAFKSDGTDGKIKLKGKERLANMLKSGRETKIFALKNSDLKQFAIEAKRYGVTYCVLKDKTDAPDSTVEIMVTDTDASKISRIMDRLEFAAVDLATLESAPAEREAPDRDDTDKLLDQLLDEDGSAKIDTPEADKAMEAAEQRELQNPTGAGRTKNLPSEPRSEMPSPFAEGTPGTKKPASVKEFLQERTTRGVKKREKPQPERAPGKAKTPQKKSQHQQPPNRSKKKSKKRGR